MMCQHEIAFESLSSAIDSDPSNTKAYVLKGIFELRLDRREDAIATWEAGVDAQGGSSRQLEHLLGLARKGATTDEILSTPPPPG